ncbi:RNA polymerase (plasmid) [Azospirillum sp. TSH58]|uniref:RNA polymerase sigma factor n=1 Tax=Azospirillum sp. TSH58 TaxID=664962 RepID=UPI000D6027B7|nr:RNA polymerase sigma factor [Azospirillum sp. TSH58]AWJ85980.1 RNA polymerase [Azospirillum sp. TSH58]PWC64611.1 RNA polymerase [Azospirillum sp. TSH58]
MQEGAEDGRVAVIDEDDDESLMAETAAGNRAAFDRLTRRHLRRSLALAHRVVGNASDAEEVVQDAFLQIWTHADRWRGDGTRFSTWLYRIVVNRSIDYRRRKSFQPLDDAVEIVDPAVGADGLLAERQLSAAVDAAIAALPERQRAALSLCYYQEMNCAEASEVLNVSVSAMESLLVRARRMVRTRLNSLIRQKDGDEK